MPVFDWQTSDKKTQTNRKIGFVIRYINTTILNKKYGKSNWHSGNRTRQTRTGTKGGKAQDFLKCIHSATIVSTIRITIKI